MHFAYFGNSLVGAPIPQLNFYPLQFGPFLPPQLNVRHSPPPIPNTMTGPCPKRKLAAVSTIVHGQSRQRAEDGGRGPTKVLKTSHDIQHCNGDSAGTSTGALPSRQTSALAMLSKVHHPESCPPQFLYMRPGAGKLVWVAVLLFRGRYWTSDIHLIKQDARIQVAQHAVEWLYSNDLEPSNTNPSFKAQDTERKGLWKLELDWTELKKQSVCCSSPVQPSLNQS